MSDDPAGPRPPDGAWVACAWCGAEVALARFAAADEEVGASVAVCPGCHRRIVLPGPG